MTAVVEAWVRTHGQWCPGYNRPGHYSEDLTAEHDEPWRNGQKEGGRLSVLCRSCNSAKGNAQRGRGA